MRFFVGLHQPSDARHFDRCFISVNRLRRRKSEFQVRDWIMDSGAFTEISTHGEYRASVEEYAAEITRWANCGNLLAAVAQDYMCEPFIVEKTGLTVAEHQVRTVIRFIDLWKLRPPVYVMPVLQGYQPSEYAGCVRAYGNLLPEGAWVGVGSVCKRNAHPRQIEAVLGAILDERPDLRLHGFGLKKTALASCAVRRMLYSADSMAWSYQARMEGRSANDWREAERFTADVERYARRPVQHVLF